MSEGIHASLTAVESLLQACNRFTSSVGNRLDSADHEAERYIGLLEDKVQDLRSEASSVRERIADLDPEDEDFEAQISRLHERSEEIQDEARKAARARDRLQDAQAACRKSTREMESICTDQALAARLFLERASDNLKAYLDLALDDTGTDFRSSSGNNTGSAAPTFGAANGAPPNFDPTGFALPDDFIWVPLSEIDRISDRSGFDSNLKFEKVSREDMQIAFQRMKEEILPTLRDQGASADQYFGILDQQSGRSFESGSQRAYQAFFGQDAIHLTKNSGSNLWNVTNGRHRIEVAQEMGWSAVPVRLNPNQV